MKEKPSPRTARFRVGDRVRAVGPSAQPGRDNIGSVTELLGPPENAIYRYRVTFAEGSSELFFGFELELVES